MNCKHCEVKGNTTKHFWCRVKDKAVDNYSCKNCLLKIGSMPKVVEDLFGTLKGK